MSLSSLGQQLAALNAPGKNVGSVLPSSKRHEDAIGRGLSHSVQVGHSVNAKSHLNKASIIYEDSRKASDVPLTTIRENCVASLRQLESLDPVFGQFIGSLCKQNAQERGLLTASENEKVDKLIEDLLYRLALRMTSRKTLASCLHVIEFLLRRYDLHARPKTAANAILVLLPLHEEPFFLRLLQLVDLASLPEWAFLRPFAAPGAKLSRQTISKQASKDNALTREICRLSQRNSKLPNHAQSLSFTAAVLIESMALQTRQSGTMSESTCQVILPYVVASCRQSKIEGYQNWGHVMASAVVENSVLAQEPRKVLETSVLQGLAEAQDVVVLNGIVVLLTILAKPLIDDMDAKSSCLPMIRFPNEFCGFCMDKSTFTGLLKIERLAARLGHLFAIEGITEIRHLVASCLVMASTRAFEYKGEKKSKLALQLVFDFVQETKLQSLWKDSNAKLVSSFTSFLVINCFSSDKQGDEKVEDNDFLALVQALRRISIDAHDEGLAHALMRTKNDKRLQLAKSLGIPLKESSTVSDNPDKFSFFFPTRVALEHADSKLRLEAIARARSEYEMKNDEAEADGEGLFEALLRRFAHDDNEDVALAAGKALSDLLKTSDIALNIDFAELTLQSLFKWSHETRDKRKSRVSAIALALELISRVSRYMVRDQLSNDMFVRLIEAAGSHMHDKNERISLASTKAVCFALKDEREKTAKKDTKERAQTLLVSSDGLLSAFKRTLKKDRKKDLWFRRLFVRPMLEAWADCLQRAESKKSSVRAKVAGHAFDYITWVIKFRAHVISLVEMDLVSACLSRLSDIVASNRERLVENLRAFAAQSGDLYTKVSVPFILSVCEKVKDGNGNAVSIYGIVMEVALGSSSSDEIENLLGLACELHSSGNSEGSVFGFAPALALLGHSHEEVRKKSLSLLFLIGRGLSTESEGKWRVLSEVSSRILRNKSSAILGGSLFISKCLQSSVLESKHPNELREALMKLCVFSASASASLNNEEISFESSWLPIDLVRGGCQTASFVLSEAELAGENAFPLLVRWKCAGKVILQCLLSKTKAMNDLCGPCLNLIECIVCMLKGITVLDSAALNESQPKTIISSGPNSAGRRARSYSFGKCEGLRALDPYPNEMQDAISQILSSNANIPLHRMIQDTLFRVVISRKSWEDEVFRKLQREYRQKTALLILDGVVSHWSDRAEEGLYALALDDVDIKELISQTSTNASGIAAITFLSDFISAKAENWQAADSFSDLISALLLLLSKMSSEDHDELDFAWQSIITAVGHLVEKLGDVNNPNIDKNNHKEFSKWMDSLLGFLGSASEEQMTKRLPMSTRTRSAALNLFAALSSKSAPQTATTHLIPAIQGTIQSASSDRETRIAVESFSILVTEYCKHSSSAKLPLFKLFKTVISCLLKSEDEFKKLCVYKSFVEVMAKQREHTRERLSTVGCLVSAILASEVKRKPRLETNNKFSQLSSDPIEFAAQILSVAPRQDQVASWMTLVNYAKNLIVRLTGKAHLSYEQMPLAIEDLEHIAFMAVIGDDDQIEPSESRNEGYSEDERDVIMSLSASMLELVKTQTSMTTFRRYIKNTVGAESGPLLSLWHDLLFVQAACAENLNRNGGDGVKIFWTTALEATKDTLDDLQNNLPSHIFLAFATNIVKEGGTDELRSKAACMIADRALTLEPDTAEAALFCDMIPFFAGMLDERLDECRESLTKDSIAPCGILLKQSSMVVVESITRALYLAPSAKSVRNLEAITTAVENCGKLLASLSEPFDGANDCFFRVDSSCRKLISSAALFIATAIRVCGPRCLPSLPKLMKSLVSSLSAVNCYFEMNKDQQQQHVASEAKLMQLSLLRSLTAMADTLPQFMPPYMDLLLDPSALPSEAMRSNENDQEIAVDAAATLLEGILSSKIPARVLIPAVSTSISKITRPKEIERLLLFVKASIEKSSGSELSTQKGNFLRVATFAFEFSGYQEDRQSVFKAAIDFLLVLVLKFSEVQLRPFFAKFREWRGEVDGNINETRASRNYAFWSFAACLAKELKSIFLPCLGSVFCDVIEELVS